MTQLNFKLIIFISFLRFWPLNIFPFANTYSLYKAKLDDKVSNPSAFIEKRNLSAFDLQSSNISQSDVVKQFLLALPFLSNDLENLTDTVNFIKFAQGNYTGQIKNIDTKQIKRHSDGVEKEKELREVKYNNETNDTEKIRAHILRHGWGKMCWNNGTLYGINLQFIYSEGDEYIGEWVDDTQNGIGILRTNTGVYVGEWSKGLQQGNGTALYNNGNTYKGEFWEGLKHGKGIFEVSSKGDIYTGQFKNGMRHGKGAEYFGDTSERYVGEYVSDMREGIGSAYHADGSLKYTGSWKQGHPNGIGTAYYSLYDTKAKSFIANSIHGLFLNGAYVGPAIDDRLTRNLTEDENFSHSYEVVYTLFGYARRISRSVYHNLVSFLKFVFQKIRNFY